MRSDRELLEDALCLIDSGTKGGMAYDITREIRARLEEPEPEPVAWAAKQGMVSKFKQWEDADPLYRHPPRQMTRLSDEEIREVMLAHGFVIAAQQAERERIKGIVKDHALGGWIRCCNQILERIDE